MLVLFDGWDSFFRDRSCPGAWRWPSRRASSSSASCCRATSRQRWYAAKSEPLDARRAWPTHVDVEADGQRGCWRWSTCEAGRATQRYFLPLALAWEDRDEDPLRALGRSPSRRCASRPSVASRTTRSPTGFCRALVAAIGAAARAAPAGHAALHLDRGSSARIAAAIARRDGRARAGDERATRRCCSATGSSSRATGGSARRQPGARDGPLPDRRGGLPALRAGRRRRRVRRADGTSL